MAALIAADTVAASQHLAREVGMHWTELKNIVETWATNSPQLAAQLVLNQLQVKGLPVNVEALCNSLGIAVYRSVMDVAGAAKTDVLGYGQIWVRAGDSHQRQRFTMAHELGHILLHPIGLVFRDTELRGSGDPIQERQANRFATSFLMPTDYMHAAIRVRGMVDGNQLARDFDVSAYMILIRLRELGYSR
jgi:Zn-dependent peptidase ImmA (M78 family)